MSCFEYHKAKLKFLSFFSPSTISNTMGKRKAKVTVQASGKCAFPVFAIMITSGHQKYLVKLC